MSEEEKEGNSSGGLGRLVPLALICVIVGLLASAVGGGVFWVLLSRSGVLALQPGENAEQSEGTDTEEQEACRSLMETAGILDLEPFVVNLADTDSPRYLRVKITLMVDDKTIVEEVMENATMVSKARDVILQTLSRKRSDEIINEEGRSLLRVELLERLEPYFHEPKVIDVMFTEFVVQL